MEKLLALGLLLLLASTFQVAYTSKVLDEVSFPEDIESAVRSRKPRWDYTELSDDEDLLADEASGDDEIGSADAGSGMTLPPEGTPPTVTPMTIPSPPATVYYRALVNFTHTIDFSPALDDVSSEEFRDVSEAVVDTLESEYYKIPGEQIVSVVFVKEIDGNVFVELDVGSEGNSNDGQIREVLYSVVESGSIASYVTSTEGFQFRRLGSVPMDVRKCTENEFTCRDGGCVPLDYRCDRRPDCRDMSDEEDCEVTRCGADEFHCESGECIPIMQHCDRRPDCADESDESNCAPFTTPAPLRPTVAPFTTRVATTVPAVVTSTRRAPPTTPPRRTTPKPPPVLEDRPCRRDEARCPNGQCIPRDYLCDGERDCRDGEDELNCGTTSPCEPNEFKCRNGRCALKLWRCDGDDDCGDRSDEINCPTKSPGDTCAPDQFTCVTSRTCIPASYQCDDEADCPDRTDEVGCSSPQVITPPEEAVVASRGETVRFTCVAVGVPTPIITWRLNWGHIPTSNRVSMMSEGGHGTLIIRDVKEADQGAYTCEAINAKGMVFGIPDGVLILKPSKGPCPAGQFQIEGTARCVPCFCFGVSKVCQNSGRYRNRIHLRFDAPDDFKGVNISMPSYQGPFPLSSNQLQINPGEQEFQLVDLSRRFLSHDSFWTLPSQFLGNKVDSYGGFLGYKVQYMLARGQSEPVQKPDVIIVGNGRRLIYRIQGPTQPATVNQRRVQLTEENWQRESGAPVTREDFMMTLQNLEGILIQTVYNNRTANVGLSDVVMDTTTVESTSLGLAQGVEECRCPAGYLGLSCETCATKFERVPGGSYLGTCAGCRCNGHASSCDPVSGYCLNCQHNTEGPQCNKCKSGFFGDATKGTSEACRPCPCPTTDPWRRYSDTCFLDIDGQPTCDNCAPGYTGRRCERCAEGFEGNPFQPGGKCQKSGESLQQCDERGSRTPSSATTSCLCKPNVVGNRCDECKSGAFYLSDKNPEGCLKCFCMGVTKQCASSYWNRDQVRASYGDRETPSFVLSNLANTRTFGEGIRVRGQSELIFDAFNSVPQDHYYWVLPERFKGDKVTSYGGELRYTVIYTAPPGSQTLYGQPDVILQGNGIFLEHFADSSSVPGVPLSITVPFREHFWRRADGREATREHLLMALADINLFMIRASYSERMTESRILNINMDVAVPHATGLERALEVEHCVCPEGYRGPSCQECDVGYTRSTSGLYLGTCVRCECGGHSTECDEETGECLNCQHNTEGARCERCKPEYYGDARRGTFADCQPCPCQGLSGQHGGTCFLDTDGHPTCDSCAPGYMGRQCERCAPGYVGNPSLGQPCRVDHGPSCRCDAHGSLSSQCDARGRCQCKSHVEGPDCSTCRAHHFHLSAENQEGCLPCFCMGVTQLCTSTSYHRHLVTSSFLPGNFQNFALVNRQHSTRISTGFTVEMSSEGPQLSYDRFGHLGQDSYYWQLPEGYQGDKVGSYGGRLRYRLSYNAGVRGSSLPEADVQITGNDIMLVAYQPELRPREPKNFEVIFREQYWKRPDGQQATREHLMMVLADLDEILIRATYSTDMVSAGISGVSMETAAPTHTSFPRALEVEECQCPPGYTGLSCQDCAPGYTRTGGGLYLGHCELCECNGHSDSCHPETGACSSCSHNTVGEFCDQCAPGFYGDATAGTPEDCQPCACPLTDPENQFSRTCESLGTGGYRCTACQPGYTGQYCERCAQGYVGNPNIRGQKCIPGDRAPLVVRVHPQRTTISQGSEVSLRCQVSGNPPFYFYWSREDGRPLSSNSQKRAKGEELYFPNIQPSDAGIYICTCRNLQNANTSRAEVIVTAVVSKPITVTVEEKKVQNVQVGADVTFVCTAKSKSPAYTLVWTRQNNGKLPERAMDFNGILTIRGVQLEDAGVYVCTGSNMFDMDEGAATLYVQDSTKTQMFYGPYETFEGHRLPTSVAQPTATIEPQQLTVQEGHSAEFRCIATGQPPPTLEWTGGPNGVISPKAIIQDGILHFPAVERTDEAQYSCRVRNSAGHHLARTFLHVHSGNLPEVQVSPERTEVQEGDTVRLYCRASGSPTATISWKKEGGSLPSQSRAERTDISTLVIPSITAADGGVYLCVGTSSSGSTEARIKVSVIRVAGAVDPVRIESSLDSITEGQTVDLVCMVEGQPQASVRWHRPGGSLPPNHQISGSRLRILHASLADAGEYVCQVRSDSGTQQASFVVSVAPRVHPGLPSGITPTIRIEPSSSSLTEGQTIELNCVTTGHSQPAVTWYRPGGTLSANHQVSGSRLRIIKASSADSGEYICRVSSGSGVLQTSITISIGSTISSDIALPVRIESSSDSITEGQTVDLSCVVAGHSQPTVTWYKKGGALSSNHQVSGSRLRIVQATAADSGEYICRVSSGAGMHEASVTISVTSSASSSGVGPPVRIESSSNSITEGQSIELNCVVAGQSRPTVMWYRPGGALSSNHQVQGPRLRIVQATVADSGEYICRARTGSGTYEGSVTISVGSSAVSPDIVSPVRIESPSTSITEGQSVELNCVVAGQSRPTVIWYRPSAALESNHQVSGSRLRIVQATSADSGKYICRVSSDAGTYEGSITISVTSSAFSSDVSPVRIESSSNAITEGQTLELNCIASGQSQATVIWYRPGGTLTANHQVSGSRLRIVQATSADSGEYVCRVSSDAGTHEGSITISVTGSSLPSPLVKIEPSSHSITEGQTVELNCLVTGHPQPMVTWHKKGGTLSSNHQVLGSWLRIVHFSPEDSGEYICRASTSSGTQEASIIISITSSPGSSYRLQSPVISIVPHSAVVRQGENATFKCRIHDGVQPIRMEWKMTNNQQLGDNVKISSNGSIITIVGARHSNQGAYRCVASNLYGVAHSVVNLMVQGPPSVSVLPKGPVRVKVGQNLNLECMGTGDPRPVVNWHRMGGRQRIYQQSPLPLDSHAVLQIASVKPEDAGIYVCVGQSPVGSSEVQVEVQVESHVVRPGAPQVTVEEPVVVALAGTSVILRCSASGHPKPTIHWSKLRAPLPWQHQLMNETLVIPNVAQQDSGQYICNASNTAGHSEVFVTLDVETPPYATSLPDELSVSVGEVVQLQCLAHGTPPLRFQWTKVNGSLSDGASVRDGVLHINPVAQEDDGRYRCIVNNKVGSGEAFAQVSVLGAPLAVRVSPQIDVKGVSGTAEFVCNVIGGSQARIEWFKEGGQLPAHHSVQDRVLRIQNLDRGSQGIYTCRATSVFGQAQDSAKLVIQALPRVMINIRTSVQTVLAGNSVEFECLAIGDPQARITWSKVGGRLPPDAVISGGMLKIEEVKQPHAGQYRCTATNDMGTVQSHIILRVQSVPQIANRPELKEVASGSSVVLPCLASGFPVPEISWTKLEGDLPRDARPEGNILMIPSIRMQDAGTYMCTAANRQGKVTAFSVLRVQERVIPYFTDSLQSFLKLPTIKDAYNTLEIRITFRPDTADGMLLFNGQKKSSNGADFISFGLVGGRPEVRFDAGSGMATVRYPTPIKLGEFHTVTIYRNRTRGSLVVDDQLPVNGTSQGKFQGLDLNEELYLGGYPNYDTISKTGLKNGFVGCVSQLVIQGEEVIFKNMDLSGQGISNCPTCRDQPCQNRGICQDSESSNYVCICPQGFTGSNCEHFQAFHCHPEACGPNATCINREDGLGYNCRCHLGKAGDKCMEGVMVTRPFFSGDDSFISYPPLTNIHYELRVDMEFKPLSPSGLLLFSGGKAGPMVDFVSLAMVNGYVEFRYELGSGLAILRSASPIALGQWHKISAERLNKDGTLQVDSSRAVKRSSPGKSQGLNLRTLMFLGGVDRSTELPAPVNVTERFHGCIGEVSINGKKVDISYSFMDSYGISQCQDRSPCDSMPCLQGGRCMPSGEDAFQCLCQDGFKGSHCEITEDECLLHYPCLNGGTCKGRLCACPHGFSGTYCERGSVVENLDLGWHEEGSGGNDAPGQYGAYFSDDAYIALPRQIFPRSLPEAPETIELEIRTSSSNGLILWQGVAEKENGKTKDFISIGLKDGHLVFSYQLGSGEANIISEDPVNDGEWHKVMAIREGKTGSIQVDGEEMVNGQSPGSNIMMNTKGHIYLGGAPHVKMLTGKKYLSGITGCLKNIVLMNSKPGHQPHQPVDLKHHVEAGHNTRECPS